jgi:hypothetical protein
VSWIPCYIPRWTLFPSSYKRRTSRPHHSRYCTISRFSLILSFHDVAEHRSMTLMQLQPLISWGDLQDDRPGDTLEVPHFLCMVLDDRTEARAILVPSWTTVSSYNATAVKGSGDSQVSWCCRGLFGQMVAANIPWIVNGLRARHHRVHRDYQSTLIARNTSKICVA